MMKNAAIVCLAIYFIGLSCQVNGEASISDRISYPNSIIIEPELNAIDLPDEFNNNGKRTERYAFGLGRRAYTYTNGNGVKRLPVYNFGLGKRARPYSFGLGKRGNDLNDENELDLELQRYLDEKRNRPYSFGLGKREPLGRTGVDRYGFGLGRR